jgi:hypothetical protein
MAWALVLAGCAAHFPKPYADAPVGFARYPGEYLCSDEIRNQSSDLPELVTTIQSPTLGCPARIDPKGVLEVLTEGKPGKEWKYFLLPRTELGFLEETDFVLELPDVKTATLVMRKRDEFSRQVSLHKRNGKAVPALAPGSEKSSEEDETFLLPPLEDLKLHTIYPKLPDMPESQRSLRNLVRKFREGTSRAIVAGKAQELELRSTESAANLLKGQAPQPTPQCRLHRVSLAPRKGTSIPPGLYGLAIWDRERRCLEDVQYNAVYVRADDRGPVRFAVAADLQWGMNEEVVRNVLGFVQAMNLRHLAGGDLEPEFLVLLGDIVDCNFGSRGDDISIFNYTYTKEYMQAWLALVGLRIPCFIIPGNHDAYRFRNDLAGTQEDGLFCFRSTFGPPYFAFDRGGYRFICLNSFDLPFPYRTARVKPFNMELHEWIVPRFNILNWGGGMQRNQLKWLRKMLSGRGEEPGGKTRPLLFMHNDPRGSYPALKEGEAKHHDMRRHFPITLSLKERNVVQFAPRWEQIEELHVGHYSPIRLFDTSIRAKEWFESLMPPPFCGYPGWIRYQQGWHAPFNYVGGLGSSEPYEELEHPMVDPLELLQLIGRHEVRAIFKGHDNHFCKTYLRQGRHILPLSLSLYGKKERRNLVRELLVKTKDGLAIYHAADVADLDSDGHGYYLVKIDGDEIEVRQIDHF